jgi:hypothetical protein
MRLAAFPPTTAAVHADALLIGMILPLKKLPQSCGVLSLKPLSPIPEHEVL